MRILPDSNGDHAINVYWWFSILLYVSIAKHFTLRSAPSTFRHHFLIGDFVLSVVVWTLSQPY